MTLTALSAQKSESESSHWLRERKAPEVPRGQTQEQLHVQLPLPTSVPAEVTHRTYSEGTGSTRTPTKMAKLPKSDSPKCSGATGTSGRGRWQGSRVQARGEEVRWLLTERTRRLP